MNLVSQALMQLAEEITSPVSPGHVVATQRVLEGLVPCDGVGWQCADFVEGTIEVAGFDPSDGAEQALRDLVWEHPLVTSLGGAAERRWRPVRISDVMSMSEFRRTRTFNELFRPRGIRYQVGFMTSGRRPKVAGWALNRSGSDFSDEEVTLLAQLQLPLAVMESMEAKARMLVADQVVERRLAFGVTAREAQTLDLLASGMTAAAIAHHLRISTRTVHKHLENAYSRLGCHDRLTAVDRARRLGLLGEAGTFNQPP